MRSATEIISDAMLIAESSNCGTRAMVPSSFMISQMTPPGAKPASLSQIDCRFGLSGSGPALRQVSLAMERHGLAEPDPADGFPASWRRGSYAHGHRRRCRWSRHPRHRSPHKTPCRSARCSPATWVAGPSRSHSSGSKCKTDQATPVRGHEVDCLGSDLFGGDGEIAFVFAVLIVYDDQQSCLAGSPQSLQELKQMPSGQSRLTQRQLCSARAWQA